MPDPVLSRTPTEEAVAPAPDPVQAVRAIYAAYARRDVTTLFAAFSPEIEVHQSELLPWGGRYQRLSGARSFFARLIDHIESQMEPLQFVPAGEQVVVVGRTRGSVRANGAVFDVAAVHVWTLHAGKATRFEAYIDTPAMLAALRAA